MQIDLYCSILSSLGEILNLCEDDLDQEFTGSFLQDQKGLTHLCLCGLVQKNRTTTNTLDNREYDVFCLSQSGKELAVHLMIVVSDHLLTKRFIKH